MTFIAVLYFTVIAPLAILYLIGINLAELGRICPKCKTPLDFEFHGYNHRYGHCHNCGFCHYCNNTSNKWGY